MIHQYRGGAIPDAVRTPEIAALAAQTIAAARAGLRRFEFSKGLEAIWALISAVDKFIVRAGALEAGAPDRTRRSQQQLDDTLYTAAEALRIATALLSPVLPRIGAPRSGRSSA